MCLAISLVLMTTLVELQSISRWHYQSTPPHLCNGPKSWGNVSHPTFPFHVLATFALSCSTFCFQMPPAFYFALGFFRSQNQRHRSGSQNLCQNRAISTNVLSPKCLSKFWRLHYMLHPIHRFWMTSSKGLSKAWLSSQCSWWTCDNRRPILKMILRLEPT